MMIGRTDTHAPCFGCDRRTIDCHADCEDYKTWSAQHNAARDKRTQEARKNGAAYLETAGKIQRELIEIESALGWRKIQLSLAARIYLCPFCDYKSPVNGAFCPECGKYVGKAVQKI